MNKVILIGRTTKDMDLRRTSSGVPVVSFTLAVENRFVKNEEGKSTADFISCVAWNKTAEVLEKYVKKGALIAVDGRIQTRNYENKEGTRVYVTEVVCENMKMLDTKGSDRTKADLDNLETYNPNFEEEKEDEMINEELDIDDDDLPF